MSSLNSNAAARLPFLKAPNTPGATNAASHAVTKPKAAGTSQGDSSSDFSRLLVRSQKAADASQRAVAADGKGAAPHRPDSATPSPRADAADSCPADSGACQPESTQDAPQMEEAGTTESMSPALPTERPATTRLKYPLLAGKGAVDVAAPGSAATDTITDPNGQPPSAVAEAPTAADLASLVAWGVLPMPPVLPPTATAEGRTVALGEAAPLAAGRPVAATDPGDAGVEQFLPADPMASSDATERDAATPEPTDKTSLAIDVERPPASGSPPDDALASLAMLSAGVRPESERQLRLGSDLATPPAWAVGASGASMQSRGIDASAPAVPTSTVATPLTDGGFHEALGLQVSLLARDGIHQAELRLNPADMGPVSVQITMNGDQARVDFSADLAQTRQVIEAGWAELAASLQEAGFTLSGGGVSEHARKRQEPAVLSSRGADRSATAEDAPVVVAAARPRAGAALDLYA
ncbi:MAG: flagellar hook-length control protein FliK [Burkholderiaceae bacterium]|nr:flagellar hook-length control protein FliK [Burkholderiaceae bacterium]